MNDIPIKDLMQHADSLYRFALSRVKDHHVAEDLVQDCLSAGWQRIDSFDGRSVLSTCRRKPRSAARSTTTRNSSRPSPPQS